MESATHIGASYQPYMPASDEIADACDKIQTTWSAREKKRRSVGAVQLPWTPPIVKRDAVEAAWDNVQRIGRRGV
jgi:hypothetical protein